MLSVIVLIAGWVVLALMTQSFFLLSSIPLLARELGYSLHKLVDIALPLP